MSKAMFQISGASDSGEIKGTLGLPDDETLTLTLDAPVELEQSGEHILSLEVEGFPLIKLTLNVDISATPPTVVAKDNKLPLACRLVRQQSADVESGEQSSWLHLLRCDFACPRELVHVSGADYAQEDSDYTRQAKSRRHFQTQKDYAAISPLADSSTIVTHFNFSDGYRRTYMLQSATRWMVVDKEDFGAPACNEQSTEGLSITHVYDWLEEAGKAMAGRVVEFAIFAKAGTRGPVLVNSADEASGNERDPCDHDCRIKDFNGSNVDVATLGSAFAEDAQCHIFTGTLSQNDKSCASVIADPEPENTEKKYRVKRAGGGATKLTWQQCKMSLQRALRQHFAAHLADAIGVNVWACSPGSEPRLNRLGKRHYWDINPRKYGAYVDSVANAFSLEKNDAGYLAYTRVMVDTIDGPDESNSEDEAADDGAGATADDADVSGIEFVTPTDELKQYVNVGDDITDGSTASDYGPKVNATVQLDPPDAGVTVYWAFSGTYAEDIGETDRPGFGEGRNDTASSTTDGSGIAQVDFYLTPHGGDELQIIASKTPDASEAVSPTITVWRKVWYEIETMLGADGQPMSFPYFDLVTERAAEVFVELEATGHDNRLPHTESFTGDHVIGFAAEYFSAEKTPYQVHLVTVDRIRVLADVVYYSEENGGQPIRSADIKDIYNTDSDDWFKNGTVGLYPVAAGDGDPPESFNADVTRFALMPSESGNDEHYVTLAPDFIDAIRNSGKYDTDRTIFKVAIEVVADLMGGVPAEGPYRFQCYLPMGAMNDLEGLGHDFAPGEVPTVVSAAVVHELAHVFGMVPTTVDNYDKEHEETGPHCKKEDCLMYWRLNAESTGRFCPECIEAWRKIDLSKYKESLQANRGAKA